jgi:ATP-binding cassette subfamily B protein
MGKFDKKLVGQYEKLNIFNNKVSAKVFDVFSNITSVVILSIKKVVLKDIEKTIEKPRSLFIKNTKLNEWKWFSIGLIVEIFVTVPLILYILYKYSNNILIEIGTITALYMYLRNITGAFSRSGRYYESVIEQKVKIKNIKEIEDSFVDDKKNIRKRVGM